MASRPRRHMTWRRIRAGLRDTWIVLRQFRRPLLIFFGVVVAAALLYRALAAAAHMSDPAIDVPSFMEAFYLMLSMIFLQANVSQFPELWYLEVFFFAMPVVGLALLGTGVANLGVLLFNKSARGKEWEAALASTFANHIIVVGLGKLGFRVVQQLLECGQDVVAVELDANKPFIPLARELGVPVIIADARRANSLVEAGIDRASSIVCCTQDDLANLDIALDARERRPEVKIVLRMFDAELARKVERGFGIHTAFSTSTLAAPAFAAAAMRAHIEYSFQVGGQLLNVAHTTVEPDSPLVGQTIGQVERNYALTVVMHRQDGERLHPAPDEVLRAGDGLTILAVLESLSKLGVLAHTVRDGAQARWR
ncbi:MAG TPA: NAD-binding protein [Anaerolineae bacterium]|nr:NAD-binding protein [Anaerolineae bacterium]